MGDLVNTYEMYTFVFLSLDYAINCWLRRAQQESYFQIDPGVLFLVSAQCKKAFWGMFDSLVAD